jgi:hypothetical protein
MKTMHREPEIQIERKPTLRMPGSYPFFIIRVLGFLFAFLASTTMSAPTIVTEKDAGQVISISTGDQLEIVLKASPSTGYT